MKPTTMEIGSAYHTYRPTSPSERVVEAVAIAEGVDETDLPPLYDAIDPDALDSLFHPRPTGDDVDAMGAIYFTYNGHEVRVSAAGEVQLVDDTDR